MGRKNSCSGMSKVVSPMRMADRGNVLSPEAPREAVSIGDIGTPQGAHGNCGCNCKRASCRPVVSNASATPSSRAKKRARRRIAKQAMEERLDFIMKDVDFNIQQRLAKVGGERMCLRVNAAIITSSGTTPVGSKCGVHPAQLIATSTTPASQRNRVGSNCKCAKRGKPCVAIACGCKGLCDRVAGGPVTLARETPPLTRSQHSPRTYLRNPRMGG